MFEHLSVSPDIESIFYADLFLINGKVWMIIGSGKSEAARLATNKAEDCDLARDCVALTRIGNSLYGSFDPGAIYKDNEQRERLQKKYKIDYIAYCLTEQQTFVFKHLKNYKSIYKTTNNQLGVLASHHPYPAFMAKHFVSESTLLYLNNVERRMQRFIEITKNIAATQFLVVSWMPTVEEKSELYRTI